ncbi:MAG: flagellar hook-length control protein FliK [Hyphomonadaceae bacterium]
MSATPALFFPTASAATSGASGNAQTAATTKGVGRITFATVLAEANAEAAASPQAAVTPAEGATTAPAPAVAGPATAATHLAAAATASKTADATIPDDTDSTDGAASPDPSAIVAATAEQAPTQKTVPTVLVAPGLPAGQQVEANAGDVASEDGDAPTADGVTTAVVPVAGTQTNKAAGEIAAAAATVAVDEVAVPALQAATAAGQNSLAADATDVDGGDLEATQASTSTSQTSAGGQSPAKASASGVQASPAQGAAAGATAQAAANQPTAQQSDAAADTASTTSSKANVVADIAPAHTSSTQQTSHAAATSQTAQAAAPAATLQVYSRIVERFDGRAQRFEVRLDPAELGRVDVRIEVGADKKVHAVLAAHDSAALNDLMRGHRALERMLADAGIDVADGGVKFELASDSGQNASTHDNESRASSANVWRRFDAIELPAETSVVQAPQPWRRTRLDVTA